MMYDCGLILEGGGLRGLYTAGVLDYFIEKDIQFSDIYGVSAGAFNAVSYITKQKERSKNINIGFVNDKRYLNTRNIIKRKPLFNLDFIVYDVPEKYFPFEYEKFYNSKSKFHCVSTNIETGKAEYFDINDIRENMELLKSTGSLPMFGEIVEANGLKLLDGGIADSIPIEKSLENNKKNVLILTRNKDYIKEKAKFYGLHKIRYRKYPKLIEAMENRHIRYNKTLEKIHDLEEKKEIFVIRPSKPLEVDVFEKDKEKLEKLYLNGYDDAKELYKSLIEYIEK